MLKKIIWGIRALLYSIIYRNIEMPSYIGKPIYISNSRNVKFGKRCRVYPGIRAELIGNAASVKIGDNVSIGQNFHVVSDKETLKIGNDVTISGNVLITNCDHSYEEIGMHILDQELILQHTEIGDGCFIGYGAVIQAGTVLGKQCIVGANAVVQGTFDDYSVIAGVPARTIKKYDKKTKKWIKVENV